MRKIALLVTGGTIGMQTKDAKSDIPPQPLDYTRVQQFLPADFRDIEIEQHLVCYQDSSFIGVPEWHLITNKIRDIQAKREEYIGIIVSHGTDTMAYSSSAVAYALAVKEMSELTCPVVFTGSCRTPDLPNTDAWSNLADAVILACSDIREPVIVFAGLVLRPSRAMKIDTDDDAIFQSPDNHLVGSIATKKTASKSFVYADDYDNPLCKLSSLSQENNRGKNKEKENNIIKLIGDAAAKIKFSENLMFLQALPALDKSSLVNLAEEGRWKLGLIHSFGHGGLSHDFLNLAKRAIAAKKHIVIMPSTKGQTIYPPLQQAMDLGCLFAPDYVLGGLWTKLSLMMGYIEANIGTDIGTGQTLGYDEQTKFLRQALAENFIGEV